MMAIKCVFSLHIQCSWDIIRITVTLKSTSCARLSVFSPENWTRYENGITNETVFCLIGRKSLRNYHLNLIVYFRCLIYIDMAFIY